MVTLNANNLPWVLLGLAVTALLAVFYAMLRGAIVPSRVADRLLDSAEKRAEIAEAGARANTESVASLVDSVEKLLIMAENQARVLHALQQTALRGRDRADS